MWNARALAAGGSDTLRISPGSGLNVGTAMPCARPERPAWSEPSPRPRSSTSSPCQLSASPFGDAADPRQEEACGGILRLQRHALVAGQRDEETAGCLRVVSEL